MTTRRPTPRPLHSLSDLGELQRRLEAQRREAARLEAERREREAAATRERDLFARTVGPVTALPARDRAHVPRPRREARAAQRERDEQAVLRQALSDDFDVETLLDTDEGLAFRRPGVGPDVVRKLRRGIWAIQAQLDLHGLRRDEAREALGDFLRDAQRHGLRCVRVVHGKGNGSPGRESVLRDKVRRWLAQKNEVMAYAQARPSDGGAGALVVLLDGGPDAPSR
ncbi:Smr/MutS family protein [Caldimonas sp. KR1-144]|uniref:Smr/MutS family protein n=1 Tax=Caldimonas sp. KR1-144 TaxID=3400911 RepID=UPI003C02D9AB